jgi:hypothetical protein
MSELTLTLEEALKHMDEHYMLEHPECEVCKKIGALFNKYGFMIRKWWDHDDD